MIFQHENIIALPILHYKMEFASEVERVFQMYKPDCVAVELPEGLSPLFLQAAARLPDISIIDVNPLYYMCEPCDALNHALKCAHDNNVDAFCIDLDVQEYPQYRDPFPDTYSILHIGFQKYYEAVSQHASDRHPLDEKREFYMGRRLKELSLSYEKVLFVGGFHHVEKVLQMCQRNAFPKIECISLCNATLCTLTEESLRDCMAEYGWISKAFVENPSLLDRQKLISDLYKSVGANPVQLRNTLKFARNLSLLKLSLVPDLFEVLTAARGCVDDHFAYETYLAATDYPFRKNIDNLPELDLTIEDLWGPSKQIRFKFREKSRKGYETRKFHYAPSPFSICSYPKEDVIIEDVCLKLKKKALQKKNLNATLPFSSSLEGGIDVRETIRKWHEKKLYVKTEEKKELECNTLVMIFDEDDQENYPWKMTWLGENAQESDMAFYATDMRKNVIGPGISRCEYGGLLMTSPPRRLFDIWSDFDYSECETKHDVLLMAAIDYATDSHIVYIAKKAPSSKMKSIAARFGKKIIYLPLGISMMAHKIRTFHVLDGQDKRKIADEYI